MFKRKSKSVQTGPECLDSGYEGGQLPSLLKLQDSVETRDRPLPLMPSSHKGIAVALQEAPDTVITSNVHIEGVISFQKLLRIDGKFKGDLISPGKLIIGASGVVEADIELKEVVIAGRVRGNIRVASLLVLTSSAYVEGDIIAPKIYVEEGATIVGRLQVGVIPKNELAPEEELPLSEDVVEELCEDSSHSYA